VQIAGAVDRRLLLVHLQAQAPFDETPNRLQYAMPRPLATHEDVSVIGVTDKAQPPSLHLPVQLVQDDVAEQR